VQDVAERSRLKSEMLQGYGDAMLRAETLEDQLLKSRKRAAAMQSKLDTAFAKYHNDIQEYHISIYLMPKTVTSRLDKHRRMFFWQGGCTKKKYRLIRWAVICKSKRKGGLGIKDIRKMNVSLLCKWWWKLEKENGLWQELVRAKYLQNKTISTVTHRLDDSPVWQDLLKIKNIYLRGRKIETKKGDLTLFWLDPWLYDRPMCLVAPVLFDLCEEKEVTLYNFLVGVI
jgi:hypothetical protein